MLMEVNLISKSSEIDAILCMKIVIKILQFVLINHHLFQTSLSDKVFIIKNSDD